MVGSNLTDPALGTVNILHEGPETYNNIWQKVRSMWSYVYDHYYEKYDWFHIGGDDLYLVSRSVFRGPFVSVLPLLARQIVQLTSIRIPCQHSPRRLSKTCVCIWKARRYEQPVMGAYTYQTVRKRRKLPFS